MAIVDHKKQFLVLISTFCLIIPIENVQAYIMPEVKIELLEPRGIQASIPDIPGTQFFAFHGNVNKWIRETEEGEISGDTSEARNGRWTIRKIDVNLEVGDVINYWIRVQARNSFFKKEDQSWTVQTRSNQWTSTEQIDPYIPKRENMGRLVLEDHFNYLNKSRWTREIKMPIEPDYEFCVYHSENENSIVQIENGILRIQPMILDDYYGENTTTHGQLTLSTCTSTIRAECSRQAVSYSILPPIMSARLTTKDSFSIKYGTIEIRAKFPEGDWIYPEMWLEPKYPIYGPNYASGRILLGLARGNEHLINMTDKSIFDSRRLDFGVRVGTPESVNEHIISKIRETGWTQDFHTYTTVWNAYGIRFLVDNQEAGRLNPGPNSWFEDSAFSGSKKPAPFDQEFYITIGVGVGSVRVFPDGTTSSGYTKPWRNVGAKAMLNFWNARNQWQPSWKRENGRRTAFEIDYIRVLSEVEALDASEEDRPSIGASRGYWMG